ncbi:MAG: glycosyltransferase family 9 protein [Opitutaceae bacterium]
MAAFPKSICFFRLSALGDVTHVVPVVRTLQQAWPETRLTWVIGRVEHKLVGDIEGVEFIVVDKRRMWRAWRDLRRAFAGRHFDALLHMQIAFRANVLSSAIRAKTRVGYDKVRGCELHGWFVNTRIPYRANQHVLDALGSFVEPLGLRQTEVRWDLPIPQEARAFAEEHLPGGQRTLVISACSSYVTRNWNPAGYAAVAEHAARARGFRVVLVGGNSALECAMRDAILARVRSPVVDLVGKDTLKRLLAVLARADVVLAPDSGPMHFANAVGTPVIGLHAPSDPTRSGPYHSQHLCVDHYDEATRKFLGRPASALRWGKQVKQPGVMDLIQPAEVIAMFDRFGAEGRGPRGQLKL